MPKARSLEGLPPEEVERILRRRKKRVEQNRRWYAKLEIKPHQTEEAKAYGRAYRSRPEVKARRNAHMRAQRSELAALRIAVKQIEQSQEIKNAFVREAEVWHGWGSPPDVERGADAGQGT